MGDVNGGLIGLRSFRNLLHDSFAYVRIELRVASFVRGTYVRPRQTTMQSGVDIAVEGWPIDT